MNPLNKSLFDIDLPGLPLEQGRLLVAEPFLRDEYFNHAAILLADYQKGEKAMGVVMNAATEYTLGQLVENVDEDLRIPIFCGGPMSRDRLFYVHTLGHLIPESREIADGIYIGGDFEAVIDYVAKGYPTEGMIRFFAGYSGWDAGQLEEEVRNHVWAVTKPLSFSRLLVGKGNSYWHKVVRTMGEPYRGWLYHPMFPACN